MHKLATDFGTAYRTKGDWSLRLKTLKNLRYLRSHKGSEYYVEHNGIKFTGVDRQATLLAYQEIFCKNEYGIQLPLKSVNTIFDLGANMGQSTIFFAKKYPQATIHSFEPNPNSAALLQRNVAANGLEERVIISQVALGNSEGTARFFIGHEKTSMASSLYAGKINQSEIEVPLGKLSNYLASQPNDIDILKMDIEGGEIGVWADLIETNSLQKVKVYLIEFHLNIPDHQASLGQFLAAAEDAGFVTNIRGQMAGVGKMQDVLLVLTRKDLLS